MAAVAAAREGRTTLLISPPEHVGGMTAGGLGHTDIGNSAVVGGLAAEFFRRVCDAYGKSGSCYDYEPHVAEQVFLEMLQDANVTLVTGQELVSVLRAGTQLISLQTAPASSLLRGCDYHGAQSRCTWSHVHQTAVPVAAITEYSASVFIDASYEGDLLAAAGVSFAVGRESAATYNESLGGRLFVPNHVGQHQFLQPLNYTYGDGSLLPMVYTGDPGAVGAGDAKVQAYNFRLCLTTAAGNKLPITRPPGYDPGYWELLRRYIAAAGITSLSQVMNIAPLPNGKTDCNNNGPISTDFIGGSWAYPTATYAERAAIYDAHKAYTLGFLYFLASDPAVPASLQADTQAYGFAADEFVDNGGFPYPLYVREGRRMVSDLIFTQNDRQFNRLNRSGSVGLYSYNIDTHHAQRFPQGAFVRNEGDVEMYGDLGPGQMPYGLIVPRRSEATNLLVPVAVSASHLGFGAIRLEPQWMILGQSAGVAASQAIEEGVAVQDVGIATLQSRLRALGQLLDWPLP
jgi:hypothetical protein